MNMRVLLTLISILVLLSIASGEMSNNTSYINNSSNNNSSIYNNSSSYNKTVYRVLVDGYHGFFRIYDLTTEKELKGEESGDKAFNINVGDTVIWSNEDPVESFTVDSDPKLWTDRFGYLRPGKRFNYSFNRPGMYNIFIKQSSTLPYQIIIVNVPYSIPNATVHNGTMAEKAGINKTVLYKKKDVQSINSTDINNIEDNKSKITIKIYTKPKEGSGFEAIIIIPIIIIIYILKKKGT